eukprot:7326497-Prymnesium_polylepis.1
MLLIASHGCTFSRIWPSNHEGAVANLGTRNPSPPAIVVSGSAGSQLCNIAATPATPSVHCTRSKPSARTDRASPHREACIGFLAVWVLSVSSHTAAGWTRVCRSASASSSTHSTTSA